MAAVSYPTITHIAMEARPYPTRVLEGAETGLVLFAAAFLGHNDAIHFAEAGVQTTCVDVDGPRLAEMRELYSDSWEFVEADAWKYAHAAREEGLTWDVVSLDPFTGDAMSRCMESLDLWLALANRTVVLGTTSYPVVLPAAFRVRSSYYVERAKDVYWLVLTKEKSDGDL